MTKTLRKKHLAVIYTEQIVRMYKRMAEAGFLAKEPGMGAADIAKAHGR